MSSVCRICLTGNSRLYDVKNKLLLNMYENLTNVKFNSEDARTRSLCPFCYQKLLRCHTFSQMALRSEKMFSQIYDNGHQITDEFITKVNHLNKKQRLSVATMPILIIDDNATKAGSQVTIKKEPLPSVDIKKEVTTESDTLVLEDCIKSQVTLEADNGDQGDDAKELLNTAHFLWTTYKPVNRHEPAESKVLVAGKITKAWREPTDSNTQKSDVKDIHLAPGFGERGSGAIPYFVDDIAIVLATKPFIFNAFIRPVCLDFDYGFEQQQLDVGNHGKAAGWGRPKANLSNDLFVKDLHYISVYDCIADEATNQFYANSKAFTLAIADKICVAAKNDNSSICTGDSGIGVAFPAPVQGTERYYLRGVLSSPLNIDKICTTGTFYGFTSIRKHESFIKKYWNENEEGPKQIGNCVIPSHPEHGKYSTNTSSANVPSGEEFTLVTLSVSCARGYGVVGSAAVNCYSGFWPDAFPTCQRMCHLPPHPSVEYRCLVSGAVVGSRTCSAHEPAGTLVSPRCREPHYYSTNTLTFMRCNDDGSWDYIAKCKPECGKVTPAGKTLVVGGNSSLQGEIPWHVGVYSKNTSPYKQICGGSLISTNLIISAAHCFWTDVEKQLPASQFAVAVGKVYRPWNDRMDDAQKSDVKVIHLPSRYQGAEASFQDDIAVLIAETAFEYKTHVRPVCLSFDQNFDRLQLQSINKGKVAGWGLTSEDGKASPVLKVIDLPYVEVGTCIVDSPPDFREYITSDKICAGSKDTNSALCRGDSGGGLTFPSSDRGTERYYLRGVVSTAPNNEHVCNTATYTSFTKITKHEPFIKQFLTEF